MATCSRKGPRKAAKEGKEGKGKRKREGEEGGRGGEEGGKGKEEEREGGKGKRGKKKERDRQPERRRCCSLVFFCCFIEAPPHVMYSDLKNDCGAFPPGFGILLPWQPICMG